MQARHAKPPDRAPVLRTAAFLALLVLLLHITCGVLRSKNYASASASLYLEPRNSVDVLLMGSSNILNAVSPLQLWEEHGIVSNNLAQNGQVIPVTYYHLQEALRWQRPRLVVLNVYKVIQDSLYDSNASLHYTLDNMRFGLPKLRAVFDLAPEGERAEFLFDIITYHSRWKELTAADFQSVDDLEKGAQALFDVAPFSDFQPLPPTETAPPAPSAMRYLEKIVALCREENVDLLLIAVPFSAPADDEMSRQQVVNAVADYAEQWGVPYLNLMHHTEEMAFDYTTDMAEAYHPNWRGMEKITAWLGNYLAAHYDLPDRRGDPAYEDWDAALAEYRTYLRETAPAEP